MNVKAEIQHASQVWIALQTFQEQIGKVVKDAKNPHFQSKYATLEQVIDALKEPCAKAKIGYQQWADGLDIHTRVFMLDDAGDYIEQVLEMVLDANPQRMGSAITYYRRYSLGLIFNLQFADDDGNAAAGLPPKPAPQRQTRNAAAVNPANNKKPMTADQLLDFLTEIKSAGKTPDLKNIALHYNSMFTMTEKQAADARAAYKKRADYLKQCNR